MTIAPAEQTGFDPAMPLLAAALDGDRARAVISAALHRWRRDLADVELREVRLVRHKPGRRALIEYQVSFTGADGTELLTLLGKMRAKGLDRRTPALMTQLRRAVFAADSADGASVPEVIGDVPELAFWLQRKVPGRSLADWPAGDEGIRLARRVAEAAAKLHRAAVPTTRRHTVDDELRILRERFDLLATQRPALGGRLSALFAACMELGGSLRFRPTSGTHRDFHPAQVLADGDRLWLLDFDLFCAGDPALDLGNFLGHLTERAVRDPACAKALAKIGRALESRFLELAGEDSRAAVQIWETLTLARHVSISAQFSERRPFTETLLALCETRLGLP